MFGHIIFDDFKPLTSKSDKLKACLDAITKWQDVFKDGTYVPVYYVGCRVTHGVNYVFLCGHFTVAYPSISRLVLVEVNEYGGKFTVVEGTIEEVAR